MKEKKFITIAGTVGVGKTTFAKVIGERLGFDTHFERVENNPYLSSFYQDFKRWSFHLQTFLLKERIETQKEILEKSKTGIIQDRSIYEDLEIFSKNLVKNGNMTEVEFQTYEYLFQNVVTTSTYKTPDLLIYLEGSFEDVIDRIQHRGRSMEQETPIAYWKELHRAYETWVESIDFCPVLRISIREYDFIHQPETILQIEEKIKQKLNV